MNKRFKWTVQIEIDETWVADGFELTADRVQDMLLSELSYAREDEVSARVLRAPSPAAIRRAQGYSTESAA